MSDVINKLTLAGRLERIEDNPGLVKALLRDSRAHLRSSIALKQPSDVVGAYQLAYDSVRKACAAAIATQGLRVTSRGGHQTLFFCSSEVFSELAVVADELNMAREKRNLVEYPTLTFYEPSMKELTDVISLAIAILKVVKKLVA